MKRKSNKKYLIALLIVFLLLLAIGYASFSDVINVDGIAGANGTFDIQFVSTDIIETAGVKEDDVICTPSGDGKILTVKVPELQYPGAGAKFSVSIENKGTVAAIINEIATEGLDNEGDIKIHGLDIISEDHKELQPGEKCNFEFSVVWDEDSTENLTDESLEFSLEIKYTQFEPEVLSNPETLNHEDEEAQKGGVGIDPGFAGNIDVPLGG